MMGSSHVFYIPLLLLAGMVIGAWFGRRWAMLRCEDELELMRRRLERERDALGLGVKPDERPVNDRWGRVTPGEGGAP